MDSSNWSIPPEWQHRIKPLAIGVLDNFIVELFSWSQKIQSEGGVSKNVTSQNERLHTPVSAAGVVASGIEDFDPGQYVPEGQLKLKIWALAGCKKHKMSRLA